MRASFEGVRRKILACKKCATMNSGQKRVPGRGVSTPLVFFVGEAPGRLGADKTGVPFTLDRSGKLLEDMMKMIQLSTRCNTYISNIVKCNPRSERGTNRRPSRSEIENCREHLLAEIAAVRPRVLVTLGELASSQLLECRHAMRDLNGKVCKSKSHGLVIPLYHPGYVIRGNYSIARYQRDFKQLRRLIEKKH